MNHLAKLIGIIGINGKYGQWLSKFFTSRGFKVIGSDVGTDLSNGEVAGRADVVIFCVPISATVKIIESLIPYCRSDQLWMDITSLKESQVKAMLRSDADVVGLHPMSAPPKSNHFRGQTLVVCKARLSPGSSVWLDWFLEETQATIKESSYEDHDSYMSIVQALPHALFFIMCLTLRRLFVNVTESLSYTSAFYRIVFSLMGRIFGQSAELYADIQFENPAVPKVLNTIVSSAEQFRDWIIQGKRDTFIKEFNANAEFLGKKNVHDASEFFTHVMRLQADLAGKHNVKLVLSKDRSGILFQIARFFAEADVSLTSLHSQPLGDGAYAFLIGLPKPSDSGEMMSIIEKIRTIDGVAVAA